MTATAAQPPLITVKQRTAGDPSLPFATGRFGEG
jgi:hypothetical protein